MKEATTPPRRTRRGIIVGLVATLVLSLGGATGWALDRFVVRHVEIADVAAYEASQAASAEATDEATEGTTRAAEVTDDSYTSDDTSISISKVTQGSGDDTVTYYVADVTIDDATQLRSAFADNQFGENITDLVSTIATDNDAVLAINGDYYGFRDSGIVIRNGVVYRDDPARTGLAIYTDGSMRVYDETSTTADELVADGVWQTLSFGPALVTDGEVVSGIDDVEIDTNVGNHSIQGEQPRTAIGVIDENHFVFVVVDGRETGYSRGVTMTELAEIMQGLGATEAYNLDGGGSSELWFNGEVINQPSNGGERATSDILYIG
ncbi:phosphodiester glycosidase family protein [Tessaracoccus lacteus]|uniref:Phosphodiester glycosidase family protein n=1 Tax=Tessaracoccus lacteus TaxID=3041766 RepID=A0ABY8PVJ8_9ACTN|nr:phosphodiester glycosidase family protein [Tessaracoccus sp. T21]WGT46483.1 phosphodiester glycosidase family protein [Tessaracoccus sp. T21]